MWSVVTIAWSDPYGDFVEYGEFSNFGRSSHQEWPNRPSSSGVAASSSPQVPPAKRLTVRAEADARRQNKNQIASTALTIAEESVSQAMDHIQKELPFEFLLRSENCHKSFNYVHKKAKERTKLVCDKEFVWDLSFPNCTRALHATVTRWLNEEFRNPNRPKCLVLIGPTGIGKTSFALSLPGRVCYFKGRWSLNTWSEDARYLVFDDIPWDEFEKRNFPSKKDLLSANGPVSVTDKYQPTVTIHVTMPAIVLLNPGDEGSLTAPPLTAKERHEAEYWNRRAFVYEIGPDEFFHKLDVPSTSSTSSDVTSNVQTRPLLGQDNEFEVAQQQWLERQMERRRRAAAPPPASVSSSSNETAAAVVVVAATTDQSVEHS